MDPADHVTDAPRDLCRLPHPYELFNLTVHPRCFHCLLYRRVSVLLAHVTAQLIPLFPLHNVSKPLPPGMDQGKCADPGEAGAQQSQFNLSLSEPYGSSDMSDIHLLRTGCCLCDTRFTNVCFSTDTKTIQF